MWRRMSVTYVLARTLLSVGSGSRHWILPFMEMMMRRAFALALIPLLAQSGCFFEEECDLSAPERVASEGFFNPESGQCVFFGGGGGGGICGDFGGGASDIAIPDWGLCLSECTGLGEDGCLEAPGCRAAYASDCPEFADCSEVTYQFSGCLATAPSGPVRGGQCSRLDANECSRHDDCVALHHRGEDLDRPTAPIPPGGDVPVGLGRFERCASEQPDREVTCFGEVSCDGLPPLCPPNTVPAVSDGCYLGSCIPVDQCEVAPSCAAVPSEAACIAQDKCAPIYQGRDCSCDAAGNCSCDTQEYDRCQGT